VTTTVDQSVVLAAADKVLVLVVAPFLQNSLHLTLFGREGRDTESDCVEKSIIIVDFGKKLPMESVFGVGDCCS